VACLGSATHSEAKLNEAVLELPESFSFPDTGHRAASGAAFEPLQRHDGLGSADVIGYQPCVALEVADGKLGRGPKNPVDPPCVKTKAA
jgi:hypothetical protein